MTQLYQLLQNDCITEIWNTSGFDSAMLWLNKTRLLDMNDLIEAVVDSWERRGVDYLSRQEECDEPEHVYHVFYPWALRIVSDPDAMLMELGYNRGDFASFVADRQK